MLCVEMFAESKYFLHTICSYCCVAKWLSCYALDESFESTVSEEVCQS